MATTTTKLPTSWADAGYGTPSCCARHGNPASVTKKLRLTSPPPVWSYPLVAFGVILFVIVVTAVRKTANVPAWPFCVECLALRKKRLVTGVGLLALAAVLFVLPLMFTSGEEAGGPLMFFWPVAFVAAFAGLLFAARGGWALLSGAVVSRDGQWVVVAKSHPNFTGEVNANLAVASQQQAANQSQAYQQAGHQPA